MNIFCIIKSRTGHQHTEMNNLSKIIRIAVDNLPKKKEYLTSLNMVTSLKEINVIRVLGVFSSGAQMFI